MSEQLDPSPFANIDLNSFDSHSFTSAADALANRFIRYKVAKQRWQIFKERGLPLQVYQSPIDNLVPHTIEHNIQGIENSLQNIVSLERSNILLRPIMAIDKIYSYQRLSVFPNLKILLIGSRTEYEVLLSMGYGFDLANISAIDLLSYSPWITPGDMHALPYPDNTFDIVIMGWVLVYSSDPWLAAAEAIRVTRPGGVISVGTDSHKSEDLKNDIMGGALGKNRPRSTHGTLSFFGNSVGPIYFKNEPGYPQDKFPLESNPTCEGHVIVTFGIAK